MDASMIEKRRQAIKHAIANNALSGFNPSDYGYSVFEQWIDGHWTTDEAVALVIQHYRDNPHPENDNAARVNRMDLTDSRQLHMAEADITTLRIAQLEVEPF